MIEAGMGGVHVCVNVHEYSVCVWVHEMVVEGLTSPQGFDWWS